MMHIRFTHFCGSWNHIHVKLTLYTCILLGRIIFYLSLFFFLKKNPPYNLSPLTLPSRILCIQIDTACLWTGESDHFLTQNSHQQAHKEKAFYYLADAKIRLLCSMMHPSIKLPCVHAGLDDWISWAVYASLLEVGTPRSNSYRQCYPLMLFG